MTERPDLTWRATVRRGFSQFRATTDDPEADFLRYVEALYRDATQAAGAPPPGPRRPDLTIYLLAAALFTYGRLDVIDDLLGNLPGERAPSRILARMVSALVPLPPGLDPLDDPQATAAWISQRRDQLRWRPDAGRFVLG